MSISEIIAWAAIGFGIGAAAGAIAIFIGVRAAIQRVIGKALGW